MSILSRRSLLGAALIGAGLGFVLNENATEAKIAIDDGPEIGPTLYAARGVVLKQMPNGDVMAFRREWARDEELEGRKRYWKGSRNVAATTTFLG